MDSFRIIGRNCNFKWSFQRQTRRQSTVDTAIDDETIQSIAIIVLPLIAGPGAMATSLLISKETYISVLDGFIS